MYFARVFVYSCTYIHLRKTLLKLCKTELEHKNNQEVAAATACIFPKPTNNVLAYFCRSSSSIPSFSAPKIPWSSPREGRTI